jgi:hypothetical protein
MRIKNDSASPPRGLCRHVRRSLGWIRPDDLDGIDFIWLMDRLPEASVNQDANLSHATREGYNIYGLYSARKGSDPSYIVLLVNDIYRGVPRLYRYTPVVTVLINRTLAHEVGHHLITRRGYVFQPGEKYKHKEIEEEFADRYAFGVLKRMRKRWYYRWAMWAIKDLAKMHYFFGAKEWERGNYKKAAEYWYVAGEFDPDHIEAYRWYLRAKEMETRKNDN